MSLRASFRSARRSQPGSGALSRKPAEAVLESLRRALDQTGAVRGELVLAGPVRRHFRSRIYFVRDDGAPAAGVQWVVKQPDVMSSQEDLPNPVEAEHEFLCLVRLSDHFSTVSPELRVPQPVALLPEVAAFAMEYARGRDVTRFISGRALVDPAPLLAATSVSARFLKHLHAIDEVDGLRVDLSARAEETLAFAENVMRPLGLDLPVEVSASLRALSSRPIMAARSRLHGDFAPVNVIVDERGFATGIDASLDRIGPPEEDLARFLAMFSTERRFLAAQSVDAVQRLRSRAEGALLDAYFGRVPNAALLEVHRIDALAARWVRRQAARMRGRAAFSAVRARAVDSYFRKLLLDRARRLQESV